MCSASAISFLLTIEYRDRQRLDTIDGSRAIRRMTGIFSAFLFELEHVSLSLFGLSSSDWKLAIKVHLLFWQDVN